jgi:hypothetical protein
MNIDFNNLEIHHAVMHTVKKKEEPHDTAQPVFENELLILDDSVTDVIKERLINAMGKASKAFQLEILHEHDGSFYRFAESLRDSDEEQFMFVSRGITTLLASSQTKTTIPGGYLLILNCSDQERKVLIVIKAEPHEALIKAEGESQITLLRQVFLSPSQKLYKIGILSKKEELTGTNWEDLDKNEQYDAFLFDDQFRIKSTPAEYFYKDFLGFTIEENAKIQSQRFYDITEQFIKDNFDDIDDKEGLLRVLKDEFNLNRSVSVSPTEFADTYFPISLAETYKYNTQFELPSSIIKDPVLIRNKISKRKVEFPGQLTLSGPDESFEDRVKLIVGNGIYNELEQTDVGQYTFVRIAGRPYRNE